MPTYSFETITAAQALAIDANDALTVGQSSGPATASSVIYLTDAGGNIAEIDVTLGARTVVFGPGVAGLSMKVAHLSFDDGTVLYVGDNAANSVSTESLTTAGVNKTAAVYGGGGDDIVQVSGAHNLIQGNAGADHLTAMSGSSTIYGGQGDDVIAAGGAFNFLQGNKGADFINGSSQTDTVLGGQGNDTLVGGGGSDDFLNGNLGDDAITLSGDHGQVYGEDGNDTITAAGRFDVLTGGAGGDKFAIGTSGTAAGEVLQILDWSGSEDSISFLGFTPNPADLTTATAVNYATALATANNLTSTTHFSFVEVQVGADVIVFAGGAGGVGTAVELVGRSLADFTTHNLI